MKYKLICKYSGNNYSIVMKDSTEMLPVNISSLKELVKSKLNE